MLYAVAAHRRPAPAVVDVGVLELTELTCLFYQLDYRVLATEFVELFLPGTEAGLALFYPCCW